MEVVDGICLAFVGQFTDGADDGGGADAHGLLQRSIGGGLKQLVDRDEPFLYGHPPILKQLEAGAAGDAGEDGPGQHGGDDPAVDLEDHVHAAAFLHILVLHAVQPQHLRIAVGKGPFSGPVGSAVVAAAFGLAGAAPDSPDVLGLHDDLHRLHAVVKVAAYRGENDDELGRVNAVKPQLRIGTIQEGTDVQRGAGIRGDPALVNLHQRLDGFQCVLRGDYRQTQADGGVFHPLHVVPGAEQLHLTVRTAVGLQPFKDLGAVMEHTGGRGQRDVLEGDDTGIVPAFFIAVIHDEHVVGVVDAEAQLIRGEERSGMGRFRDADIHG